MVVLLLITHPRGLQDTPTQNTEEAIEFSVPVPEACRAGWEGKQLDEPSIKVCSDDYLDVGKPSH